MIAKVITRNSILLGIFAAATTAGIASTYLGTKDIITAQKRAAEEEALLEIFPDSRHDNSMLDSTIDVSDSTYLKLKETKSIFVATQGDKTVGFIIPAIAPEGYTTQLELIVGVNVDGSIAGVRVLSHRETPGLGDKVDLSKSDWVLGFNDKSLSNPAPARWKVKKDKGHFDQFTGATITPRAVTKAVFDTLNYFENNKKHLLDEAKKVGTSQTQEGGSDE
jgi:electron transport complex protein RnfG